jgi:hypothetical protein
VYQEITYKRQLLQHSAEHNLYSASSRFLIASEFDMLTPGWSQMKFGSKRKDAACPFDSFRCAAQQQRRNAASFT